jgi:hypothetical protein
MLQALVHPAPTKKKSVITKKKSSPLHLAPVCVGPYRIVALPKGAVQITFARGNENRMLTISKSGEQMDRLPLTPVDLADLEALFSVLRAQDIPERCRHSVYAYLKYQAAALAPESLAQWCMYVANDEGQMNISDVEACAQSLGRYDKTAQTWLMRILGSFHSKLSNS